ncbi:MAG TPA: hypothetical protein VMV10_08710 [Pirellulales bacterium]|nr:hypothetical protein [Pirellulales bacterium]
MRRFLALMGRILSRWAAAAHAARIAELEEKLSDAETSLRVATSENRLLSEIHEADVARRKRERAVFDRDRALAVAAAVGAERDESEV